MLTRVQRGSSVFAELDVSGGMDEIDEFIVLMINSNQNKTIGLAPIRIDELNGRFDKIYFDVTGMVTLSEYLTKRVSQEAFKQMLLHLIDTIENFDEYMIDVKKVVLDINSVFINEVDNTVSFVCIPTKADNPIGELYEFFKSIVVDASFVDVSGNDNRVSYFNAVYNVVKNKNGFSLKNMKKAIELSQKQGKSATDRSAEVPGNYQSSVPEEKMIQERDTVTVKSRAQSAVPVMMAEEPKPAEQGNKGLFGKLFKSGGKKKSSGDGFQGGIGKYKSADTSVAQSQRQPAQQPMQQPVQQSVQQPAQDRSFLGTIMVYDENKESSSPAENVNNNEPEAAAAYLVRHRDQAKIKINKPVFSIGRASEDQDYCINDNPAVGHKHASIIKKDDKYYVKDLNSRNHTFVNGTMIVPGTEHMLNNGDKIVFANEEFDFRII